MNTHPILILALIGPQALAGGARYGIQAGIAAGFSGQVAGWSQARCGSRREPRCPN